MGTNYYLACRECKKQVCIGKRQPAGFSFWYGVKDCMEAVWSMLKICHEHCHALTMINEHDEEHERYEEIDYDP